MNDNPGAWLVATGPTPEGAANRGADAGTSLRAASIISGELSTPHTVAAGQRSASRAVRLPGPQPMSTTYPGSSAPTLASRSKNGLERSPPNRRYRAASHMVAIPSLIPRDAARATGPTPWHPLQSTDLLVPDAES